MQWTTITSLGEKRRLPRLGNIGVMRMMWRALWLCVVLLTPCGESLAQFPDWTWKGSDDGVFVQSRQRGEGKDAAYLSLRLRTEHDLVMQIQRIVSSETQDAKTVEQYEVNFEELIFYVDRDGQKGFHDPGDLVLERYAIADLPLAYDCHELTLGHPQKHLVVCSARAVPPIQFGPEPGFELFAALDLTVYYDQIAVPPTDMPFDACVYFPYPIRDTGQESILAAIRASFKGMQNVAGHAEGMDQDVRHVNLDNTNFMPLTAAITTEGDPIEIAQTENTAGNSDNVHSKYFAFLKNPRSQQITVDWYSDFGWCDSLRNILLTP